MSHLVVSRQDVESNPDPCEISRREAYLEDSTAWDAWEVPPPEEPTDLQTTPSEAREELPEPMTDLSKDHSRQELP